jgi:pyrimidine-nucleoside phosphorylase
MISLAKNISIEDAVSLCEGAINSGAALLKLKEWISAQGGDISCIDNTDSLLSAPYKREIFAEDDGYISHIDALEIGVASMLLGAGRIKKDDIIDTYAGVKLNYTVGDYVKKGDSLATLYSSRDDFDSATDKVISAVSFSEDAPCRVPTIIKIIG